MAFNEQYIEKKKELVKNLTDIKETEQVQLDTKIQDTLLKSKIEESTSLEEITKGFQKRNEYLLDSTSGYSKKQEVSNLIKTLLVPELLGKDIFDGTKAPENLIIILRWLQKLGFIKTEKFDNTALVGLIRFQKRMGLTPDGLVGAETLVALVTELWNRKFIASILPETTIEGKKSDPLEAAWKKIGNGEVVFNEKEKSYKILGLENIVFKSQEEENKIQKLLESIKTSDLMKRIIANPRMYALKKDLQRVEKNPFYLQNRTIKRNDYNDIGGLIDTKILDNKVVWRSPKGLLFEYPSLDTKNLQLLADYLNQEYRKKNSIPESTEQSA